MTQDCRVRIYKREQGIYGSPLRCRYTDPPLHTSAKRQTGTASLDKGQEGQTFSSSKQTNRETVRTKCRLRAAEVSCCHRVRWPV